MDILFGQFDQYFQALIILMIADYLSGVMAAIYQKKLHSSVGYRGILKKCGMLICIAVARQIDVLELYDSKVVVRSIVVVFFIINEILSILENLTRMNIPLPIIFQVIMEKMKIQWAKLPGKNKKKKE